MLFIVEPRQLFSGTVRGGGEQGTRCPLAVARAAAPCCMRRLAFVPAASVRGRFASGAMRETRRGAGRPWRLAARCDDNAFSKMRWRHPTKACLGHLSSAFGWWGPPAKQY